MGWFLEFIRLPFVLDIISVCSKTHCLEKQCFKFQIIRFRIKAFTQLSIALAPTPCILKALHLGENIPLSLGSECPSAVGLWCSFTFCKEMMLAGKGIIYFYHIFFFLGGWLWRSVFIHSVSQWVSSALNVPGRVLGLEKYSDKSHPFHSLMELIVRWGMPISEIQWSKMNGMVRAVNRWRQDGEKTKTGQIMRSLCWGRPRKNQIGNREAENQRSREVRGKWGRLTGNEDCLLRGGWIWPIFKICSTDCRGMMQGYIDLT